MSKAPSPDDVATAFATIARHFTALVLDAARNCAANDTGAAYYDAQTSPTGASTFRRAAAKGAFPSFKVGRKLVARRADVHGWMESNARTPKAKAESTAEDEEAKFIRTLRLVEVKR